MNKVELIGRLTQEPEVRYTQGENATAISTITIAVDRRFKRDNEPTADFIRCVAFGKIAEFIEKYFRKGMKIALTGHIQTGSYTNRDGNKVYTTDVIVEEAEFCEKKENSSEGGSSANTNQAVDADGFMNIPEGIDEDLLFANPQNR